MIKKIVIFFILTIIVIGKISAAPIYSYDDRFHPKVAQNGMVATQEALATKVGLSILQKGGNAIDAAVAIGYTLAVTLPRAGNLGGGGFMMVYLKSENKVIAIDYREKAPILATKDMFLDSSGSVDSSKSRDSVLSVGIPGTVLGLNTALEKYGTLRLKDVIQPAINYAKKGIPVTQDLAHSIQRAWPKLQKYPASKGVFGRNDSPLSVGDRLIQKDLAWSLKQIKKDGSQAFYNGEIAKKIISYINKNQGLISQQDLTEYRVVERKPVRGNYRGFEIFAMPPPSSGGIHLVQMLNILENYPLKKWGHNSAKSIHIMAETMKRAYADRSKFLGDPDFVRVPLKQLISKEYAQQIVNDIKVGKITPSSKIGPSNLIKLSEGPQTTHYSVIDKEGNMVSNTYTLNFSYGNKQIVQGTGILLNNQMDDFSAKPGVPNAYGLIGGEFNAIEPEKRMLSSMTPTIVLKEGRPYLATGSPGGSRIITTVLQVIVNLIDHQMNISDATQAVRIHHQWLPDSIRYEKGLNIDTRNKLISMGYKLKQGYNMGSVQSVMKKDNFLWGASDLRKPGALTIGY
ncbi:gamma-glutamyltransferase [Candidatus Marinamargulisbacteria bacterium SCGC AG-410-N11]|nr:gamma-glutamyltransferase [Candidatus Marinamargulisbacteria bacterium SCGC AG-410-N11]